MTIHRRASGTWGWERRSRIVPEGRISLSLRTKDRKEALRRARALDLLLERGEIAVIQRLRTGSVHVAQVVDAVRSESVDTLREQSDVDLSLGAVIDRVMATKLATRAGGTHANYEHVTGAMLDRWGRDREIGDISTDELRSWLYEPKPKFRRPWAPNTQANVVMVAGYVWRLAIELDAEFAERTGTRARITRNPWRSIETSGRPMPRAAFLEPAEWSVVVKHARGLPEAAFLGVCCLAGLRIGEAQNLRTGIDVDLSEGVLRVQGREGEFPWAAKNRRSEREVPIVDGLLDLLTEHQDAGYAGARYFFHPAGADKPLSYTSAKKWVRSALERAGLKYGRDGELTAHSLRHTFASWLVREGWSSSLVAKLMGNTAKEVDETYSHLQPSDLTKVVATLDRLTGRTAHSTENAIDNSGNPRD